MNNPNFFRFIRAIIALTVIVFSFAYAFVLVFRVIPKENGQMVYTVAGLLFGLAAVVVNYYFGSSKDKSDQDQQQMYNTDKANGST